jgi:hypothetical protein
VDLSGVGKVGGDVCKYWDNKSTFVISAYVPHDPSSLASVNIKICNMLTISIGIYRNDAFWVGIT